MNTFTFFNDHEHNGKEDICDVILSTESCLNSIGNVCHKNGSIYAKISGDIEGNDIGNDCTVGTVLVTCVHVTPFFTFSTDKCQFLAKFQFFLEMLVCLLPFCSFM